MTEEHRINIMEDAPVAPSTVNEAAPDTTIQYASIPERFVALMIDYGIIFFPLQFIARLICKSVGEYLELWQLIAMIVGINLVFVLYETIFSSGGRVTLGKNLVGIAVVNKEKTGPISMSRAFLRAIGYYISTILFFGGFVFAFVDDRKRALHDFFGGSVVVQLRERDWWEVWAIRGIGTILLILFVLGIYRSLGGRDWQEQYKVTQARNFLEKVALLEEGHRIRYGYYTNDLLRLTLLSGDPVQFQRDLQQVLSTGRGSIKIGVNDKHYKISAVAKDKNKTPVYFTNKI